MVAHVHVVPAEDSVLHVCDVDTQCPCRPSADEVPDADRTAWVHVHRSLGEQLTDGR